MRLRTLSLPAAVLIATVVPASMLRQTPKAPARQAASSSARELVGIRLMFGQNQSSERTYDGSLQVVPGKVVRITPYRFFRGDSLTGTDSWKLTTKRINFENRSGRPTPVAGGGPVQNIVPAGVVAALDAPESATIRIRAGKGEWSLPLSSIPPGKILTLDDGDISVERVPAVSMVSPEGTGEQHDYPAQIETARGDLWFIWQAYKDRGDHVYVRRLQGGAWSAPERLTGEKGDVFRPALAEDAAGRIHAIWSERNDRDWNLVERRLESGSWSPKTTLASRSNHTHNRLVSDPRGNLHLVWVAYAGGKSYVSYSRFSGDRWSEPADVSGPGAWAPDVAADAAGNAYVAWDSYRSGNYDIYLRRIAADGALGEIRQVTKSPRFQAHPSVAVDPQGRPWLAWDEGGVNWGKDWTHDSPYRGTVLYADRAVSLAVLDGGEWKRPDADPNMSAPSHLRRFIQVPRIGFDRAGRLWLAFQSRTSVGNNREDFFAGNGRWDLYLTWLSGDTWNPATMLPQSSTRVEAPFSIRPDSAGGLRLCWATDNRPFQGGTTGLPGPYEINTARIALAGAVPAPALSGFAEAMGAAPIVVHPEETADVERMRAYRIRPGGTELRLLRGDFHRHTEISQDGAGDGSVEDYYRYMIDAARMDTGIISDHNMGNDVEYSWWRTEKSYDLYRIRDGFTPLFGYERSVPYPNGHRNIVFDHRGVRTLPISPEENKGQLNSGPILYPYLRQNRGICMEHSLATDQGTDWRDNDPELEPLVELYQGYHASYEYEGAPLAETANYLVRIHGGYRPAGFFWNALAKGLKLGVQASSDHISTHTSYAMIYTPSTERADIVQAMRERHAYAATDNIILDVQATDGERTYMMGDIFEARSGRVRFKIRVHGTDRISRLDIIRNNTFAFARVGNGNEMNIDYVDESPRKGENYYYVRVQQVDRNLVWSSPIWVRYP